MSGKVFPVHPDSVLTVDSECCLQGAPAGVLDELKRTLTIPNPKYLAAKRYARWIGKNLPHKLYYFRDRKAGFFFPRGLAKRCIEMFRVQTGTYPQIIDRRHQLPPVDFHFQGNLRDYQE